VLIADSAMGVRLERGSPMLRIIRSFATLVALIATGLGPPGDSVPPAEAVELKPVTLAVIDRETGRPVKDFSYQAWYDVPDRMSSPFGDVWTSVKSPNGTVEFNAPTTCRLSVRVKASDYVGDYGVVNEFVVRLADNPRRVIVRLRRGIAVGGRVRDSRTRNPVAGASVAPVVQRLPNWGPDDDKQVKTAADGRYEIHGVDPALGVCAAHPAYIRGHTFLDGDPAWLDQDILLTPGLTVTARVVDSRGKPLAGVKATDLNLEWAASDEAGKLVFRNPDLAYGLTFRKDGWIDRNFERTQILGDLSRPDGLVVVMERAIGLTGRVVGPGGRPVASFKVAAGPGKLPRRSESLLHEVGDLDGRFRLGLSKEGTTWIGVAASGFAPWEGWVDVKRGGMPLEVRLSAGTVVRVKVTAPGWVPNRLHARLVPRRDKSDIGGMPSNPIAEELATRAAICWPDGTLRFEHVRPDRYRLFIEARDVPTTVLALDVPDAGLDLGTLQLKVPIATGRIEGQVWHPESRRGGVWALAKGYVGGFRFQGIGDGDNGSIEFQADENGRFKVEHVPVGLTTVGFPYQVFDVINAHTWSALVVENKTTLVQAFDPDKRSEFALAFAIGDGSRQQYQSGTGLAAARKADNVTVDPRISPMFRTLGMGQREPMFRVELTPVSKGPLSFFRPGWHKLDAGRRIVLPDVGPGTYRVRVYDWLGLDGLDSGALFDCDVVVPAGGGGAVDIALGAGCITGKIPALNENFERPVEVTAVAKGDRASSRRARCDDDGSFCVRYLSPGTYSLLIHDPKSGFCRVDDIEVRAGAVDVGECTLSPGATVSGEIRFERPSRVPYEVVAVDPVGVSVHRAFLVYSSFDRVELAGLWPGRWTVSARSGDEILATGEVDVKAIGTFNVTLTAGSGRGP
jgi:hypothetical protein